MTWKQEVEAAVSMESIRKAMETAARDILPVAAKRIFEEGLDSSGQKIGEYDTKKIYISRKNSPVQNAGIPKQKTLLFPGGYREFKSEIGRGTVVNLKVFGRLQSDYLTPKKVDKATGVAYLLKEEKNAQKKDGNEQRFRKDIFSLTAQEKKTVVDTVEFEILRRIG